MTGATAAGSGGPLTRCPSSTRMGAGARRYVDAGMSQGRHAAMLAAAPVPWSPAPTLAAGFDAARGTETVATGLTTRRGGAARLSRQGPRGASIAKPRARGGGSPWRRVLVGNLAVKMPAAAPGAGSGAGVHPTTAPCYCRIRLNKLPYQTASTPLLPPTEEGLASCTSAFAAAFHVSKADLDRATAKPALFGARRTARLKVAVYAGRRGSTCGVSSGRLLGKVVVPLDLRAAAAKPVVFHSGWVAIGKRPTVAAARAGPCSRHRAGPAASSSLTRASSTARSPSPQDHAPVGWTGYSAA